jgi:acyl carrier protein
LNIEETIVGYLKQVNPSVIANSADPRSLKLRRVLDSMDMVGLLAHLESSFGFKVSDADVLAKNFETVGSVIEFVKKKTGRV